MTEKKTKKQVEEELENVKAAYEQLMGQAQELQKVSNQRLMSLRLLEGFANAVIQSAEKLSRDMNELNLMQQQPAAPERSEG